MDRPTWRPLIDLNPKPRAPGLGQRPKATVPSRIQFPDGTKGRPSLDGTIDEATCWKYILGDVVRWLVDNGHLGPEHCPISRSNRYTKYIVNTIPLHSNGRPFRGRVKAGPLWVETHESSVRTVGSVRIVIERVAPELLGEFKVRL